MNYTTSDPGPVDLVATNNTLTPSRGAPVALLVIVPEIIVVFLQPAANKRTSVKRETFFIYDLKNGV